MSFLERLRSLLAGPPRVETADAEEAAALREEFGTADTGATDLRNVEGRAVRGGGAGLSNVGFGASEAAEAAEGDLSTEEAPSDPSP
jgi:hypothetical protein